FFHASQLIRRQQQMVRNARPWAAETLSSTRGLTTAVACVFASLALALTGCSTSSSPGAAHSPKGATGATGSGIAAPADVQKAGVVTFCADLSYPPLTFMENNKPSGIDVDLADALTGLMGVKARFQQTGFPDIIGALQTSKCDAIMNGMNGTAQRGKAIAMVPYLEDGHGFAVAKSNPKNIATLDDLAGKSVAAQLGSSDQQYLEDLSKKFTSEGKKAINIVTFPQDTAAFAALGTGRVDAFFQDLLVLGYYAQKYSDTVQISDVSTNNQPIVIGVRKNDPALVAAFEKGLEQMYKNGTVNGIAKKWGIPDANLLTGTYAK
ncbi:MAG: ABC transporter substrate-binding protein, partial [Jatrophihabitantaceae bacterium]